MIEELRRSARELLTAEGFAVELDAAGALQTTNVPGFDAVLAATNAADPPDDPPGTRSGESGCFVRP